MNVDEVLEGLLQALDDLADDNQVTPVIVEGEKDVASLRSLGVEGEILRVNSGLALFNFCEEVSRRHKSAIVLTDWDARGGTLCRRLREGLEANGVRPNLEHRQRIAILCRKDVKDVEGLPNYIITLTRKTKPLRNVGNRDRTNESLRRARLARSRKD